ncbi:MAG: 2'-5' RNA ligase family protein, partial [Streptosporangiaceae bacterium]
PSPDEDRRFRGHITLARLREPADVRPLTAELAGLEGPPWTATEIQLIHSRLPGPDPGRTPVYTRLAAWPLA